MKSGRTLVSLAQELERQLHSKKDLVVPSQLVHHSTGTWEKEGEKITFVDHSGVSATYEMDLSGDQKELKLLRPIEGTDVALDMKRK